MNSKPLPINEISTDDLLWELQSRTKNFIIALERPKESQDDNIELRVGGEMPQIGCMSILIMKHVNHAIRHR